MPHWTSILKYHHLPALLASGNEAIAFFAARDLQGKTHQSPETLWDLPPAQKILRKQKKTAHGHTLRAILRSALPKTMTRWKLFANWDTW